MTQKSARIRADAVRRNTLTNDAPNRTEPLACLLSIQSGHMAHDTEQAAERARTALERVDERLIRVVISATAFSLFAEVVAATFRQFGTHLPPFLDSVFFVVDLTALASAIGWLLVVILRAVLIVMIAARDVRDERNNW